MVREVTLPRSQIKSSRVEVPFSRPDVTLPQSELNILPKSQSHLKLEGISEDQCFIKKN